MKIVAAALCFALPGCAGTIDQSRARPPIATIATTLSEPKLEHCLAGKLAWMGTPSVIRGDQATEIAFTSEFGTELLVTITPVGAGSRLDLRLKHHNYLNHIRRDAEECAQA